MSNYLLFAASLILVAVPVIYLARIAQGKITPNPVTFFIRSVVAVMNVSTYFLSNGRDPWKSSVTLVSAISLVSIFLYSSYKGKFSKINWWDISAGTIAIIVAIMWKVNNDPVKANLFLQGALLISFGPAIHGVWTRKAKDMTLPWALATSTYVLMTIALVIQPSTTWQQLVHPVFVGILGNGTLALIIFWKNKGPQLT